MTDKPVCRDKNSSSTDFSTFSCCLASRQLSGCGFVKKAWPKIFARALRANIKITIPLIGGSGSAPDTYNYDIYNFPPSRHSHCTQSPLLWAQIKILYLDTARFIEQLYISSPFSFLGIQEQSAVVNNEIQLLLDLYVHFEQLCPGPFNWFLGHA